MRYLALMLAACGGGSLCDAGAVVPDAGAAGDGGNGQAAFVSMTYIYATNSPACSDAVHECASHTRDDGGLPRWLDVYRDAGCVIDARPPEFDIDCRNRCADGANGVAARSCCEYGATSAPFGRLDTPSAAHTACEWMPP